MRGALKKRPRGKPFQNGNPGRRPGSRNKATLLMQGLAEGDSQLFLAKARELALNGDRSMLLFFLERLIPRGRLVRIALPPIKALSDLAQAHAAVVRAVSEGQISPAEGAEIAAMLGSISRYLPLVEMEERLSQMEEGIRDVRANDHHFRVTIPLS